MHQRFTDFTHRLLCSYVFKAAVFSLVALSSARADSEASTVATHLKKLVGKQVQITLESGRKYNSVINEVQEKNGAISKIVAQYTLRGKKVTRGFVFDLVKEIHSGGTLFYKKGQTIAGGSNTISMSESLVGVYVWGMGIAGGDQLERELDFPKQNKHLLIQDKISIDDFRKAIASEYNTSGRTLTRPVTFASWGLWLLVITHHNGNDLQAFIPYGNYDRVEDRCVWRKERGESRLKLRGTMKGQRIEFRPSSKDDLELEFVKEKKGFIFTYQLARPAAFILYRKGNTLSGLYQNADSFSSGSNRADGFCEFFPADLKSSTFLDIPATVVLKFPLFEEIQGKLKAVLRDGSAILEIQDSSGAKTLVGISPQNWHAIYFGNQAEYTATGIFTNSRWKRSFVVPMRSEFPQDRDFTCYRLISNEYSSNGDTSCFVGGTVMYRTSHGVADQHCHVDDVVNAWKKLEATTQSQPKYTWTQEWAKSKRSKFSSVKGKSELMQAARKRGSFLGMLAIQTADPKVDSIFGVKKESWKKSFVYLVENAVQLEKGREEDTTLAREREGSYSLEILLRDKDGKPWPSRSNPWVIGNPLSDKRVIVETKTSSVGTLDQIARNVGHGRYQIHVVKGDSIVIAQPDVPRFRSAGNKSIEIKGQKSVTFAAD